jgi:hypothetical protein
MRRVFYSFRDYKIPFSQEGGVGVYSAACPTRRFVDVKRLRERDLVFTRFEFSSNYISSYSPSTGEVIRLTFF